MVRVEAMGAVVLAVVVLACVLGAGADGSDHRYKAGDRIRLYANKVGPFHNPSETYRYYDLPFCAPEYPKDKKEALGEVLNGDRLVDAPYKLNFREDRNSKTLCQKTLSKEQVAKLRDAVAKDYYFQMYNDDLPLWGFLGKLDKDKEQGDAKYLLFKHIHFDIMYNNDRVIEINVQTDPNVAVDITEDKEVQVQFSYSVTWKKTDIPFEKRMEKYSKSSSMPQHLEIHWFSIINSCVTVLLLTGFLATILMRVLKNDFIKYSHEDESLEDQEETGWKYIHGDVFRFPQQKSLFAAIIGSGTQLLALAIFIFQLAIVGVFYPYNRGALFTALVLIYAITSGIAGYTATSLYLQLEGTNWVRNLILTGCLFCGPLFLTFCFLNTVAIAYSATAALPFGTIIVIILIWALVTSPLLVLGGIAGKNSNTEFQAPCRTTKYPREIPQLPWYRSTIPQMAMAGFLPFCAIHIELYYIFASIWGHKIYTIYSILFIVFIILIIVTAFVTVALTYFQLAVEDHEWWWRSVLCGGSTGIFIFFYCIYYYHARSDMSGFMQTSFFFGYMTCVCYGFFLMLGTVGFRASLLFVRHIYRSCCRQSFSLNWQHQLCKNPRPNPDIKTLFTDHSCAAPTNGARAPPASNGPLVGPIPKSAGFPAMGAHAPFQPVVSPSPNAIAGWMTNANPSSPHAAVAQGPPGLVQPPNTAVFLMHPRTPTSASGIDYQSADSEHLMKRVSVGQPDEVSFSGASHPANNYTQDDLPKQLVRTLNQGSIVMSLDFHPVQQTILLVGTNVGDIGIWEVGSRERIAHRTFEVWDIGSCTLPLQAALMKDAAISVNRCLWSPDGNILGVAFSKHIVQIYTFVPNGELRQQAEIDAHIGGVNDIAFSHPTHIGGVNDIAFSHPNKALSIITCGDDKLIKVWDAQSGQTQFIFEGHEAPVYSVCPHYKESIQFIFSTAIDGKIKVWLYDCLGSRVDLDTPGHWCTTMAYSADGTRLFSCGTSKDGDSHLVEWNETDGAIKRTYNGFRKRSMGVVQFDTTRNRFLAAGDEFLVKFWDMDNTNILTTTGCDGGLPASPRLRFNREGSLLAVTANDIGIKILANTDGQRLLRMLDSRAFEGSRGPPQQINTKPPMVNTLGSVSNVTSPIAVNSERPDRILPAVLMSGLASMDVSRTPDVKPRMTDESEKIETWKSVDIVDSGHLRALRLPDTATPSKVVRLLYTDNGIALLALGSNAVHKLWKWQRSDRNSNGKSTASVPPQLWQPANGILMTNDTSDGNPEEATACIALSKNNSYLMSASGGKVSLFNMMTFRVMTTFTAPPPAATFLAFHPQDNNIMAIGMEDSTIQIYNVRVDEVKSKLKGHQKKITGLAFSQSMNVLVSSGADAQLCVWSMDGWEKKKSRYIQPPANRSGALVGDTRVLFHNDQTHLLVVHESQLAIYDGKLECSRSWSPRDALPAPISSAIYSCDGHLVYAGFCDGAIGVFEVESLRLRCRIGPSSYIPASISSGGSAYPMVVAAHPLEPNQIAVGMSDGAVHVVEPLDADPKWAVAPPQDNGAHPAISAAPPAANNQTSDQPTR